MLPAKMVPSVVARMGRSWRNPGSTSRLRQRLAKRSSLIERGFQGAGVSATSETGCGLYCWSKIASKTKAPSPFGAALGGAQTLDCCCQSTTRSACANQPLRCHHGGVGQHHKLELF